MYNTHMRYLIIAAVVLLTGCTSVDYYSLKKASMGYKPYDPCIRCGETWSHLPNFEHEAQRRNSLCRQGIDIGNNCY